MNYTKQRLITKLWSIVFHILFSGKVCFNFILNNHIFLKYSKLYHLGWFGNVIYLITLNVLGWEGNLEVNTLNFLTLKSTAKKHF